MALHLRNTSAKSAFASKDIDPGGSGWVGCLACLPGRRWPRGGAGHLRRGRAYRLTSVAANAAAVVASLP